MQKHFYVMVLALFSLITPALAQFNNNGGAPVQNDDIDLGGYRTGLLGVGFMDAAQLRTAIASTTDLNPTPVRARFTVRDGILAHYVDGAIGQFNNTGNTWSGLGEGNPSGTVRPYGLSITRSGSVGFFNLLPNADPTLGEDLIAGFGTGNDNARNRFFLRAYNNVSNQPLDFKNLLVANPRGAVGINEQPFASFSVYSGQRGTLDPVQGNSDPLVKAIAIRGDQPFGTTDPALQQITTASAMGNQANTSLLLSRVAVEGTRSQIPSFVPDTLFPNIPANFGVAVNIQAVFDPTGGPKLAPAVIPSSIVSPQFKREYAELTWQDLDYLGNTTDECINADSIQNANKFYISFRNGRTGTVGGVVDPVNGNSFSVNNKRPVMTFTANGRIGINTVNPVCNNTGKNIFLDVNGWINTSSGTLVGSDRRFKKDIKPIEDAMEKIRRLQGTTYLLRTDEFPARSFDTGLQYGFIAQDLEKVLPELTGVNSDGYYAVNYTALIPVLTEAIKEQDATITTLQTELADLRRELSDLKSNRESQNTQGFRLEQNAPNPFSNNTVIAYEVPVGTTGAILSVYDLTGRMVRSFNLTDGAGSVTINAGDLADGLYIYDLQVNGRQILERKMQVVRQ